LASFSFACYLKIDINTLEIKTPRAFLEAKDCSIGHLQM